MNITTTRFLIVFFSYILSYFLSVYFGTLYGYLFPFTLSGGFIGDQSSLDSLFGLPLAVIFLLTLLMHSQGGKYVWWWIIIALLPAILFEVFLDPFHIYVPLILGLIAWSLGTMAHTFLKKFYPSFIKRITT